MRRIAFALSILAGSLGLPAVALAQGITIPDVGNLVRNSAAIVVGTLSSTNPGAAQAPLSLDVVRVLKGPVTPGSTVLVTRPKPLSSCPEAVGQGSAYGIWFLAENPGGGLSLARVPELQTCDPLRQGFEVPAGPVAADWQYSPDADPRSKLADELAWSLTAYNGSGPEELVDNPFLLDGTPPPQLQAIYQVLRESPVPFIRARGLLGLARLGDPGALSTIASGLAQLLATRRSDQHEIGGTKLAVHYDDPTISWYVAMSLSMVANPADQAVSQLGRIINSSVATRSIRRAAAHALANIHTALAAKLLAPLLDSPDPWLRADAVGGLACFANALPVISAEDGRPVDYDFNRKGPFKTKDTLAHWTMGTHEFLKNPGYYLDFWKSWWAQNSALIQAQ